MSSSALHWDSQWFGQYWLFWRVVYHRRKTLETQTEQDLLSKGSNGRTVGREVAIPLNKIQAGKIPAHCIKLIINEEGVNTGEKNTIN